MSCIDYFYRLLARREYSAYELRQKGKLKGFGSSEITEAINDLQSKGYQSDIRFVENIINSYTGKYGKSVVKRKCFEKGISNEVFEQVWLEKVEQSENEQQGDLGLKAKVMRKYKIDNFADIEPKTKAKLVNYLNYRGFNPFELLDQWQREEKEVE